jgi:hypothetical protein
MAVRHLRARAVPNSRWPDVAVLIPCYNEEVAIGHVVAAFRTALPEATIYVYDNNSRDQTATMAAASGAVVRRETLQGKGHVVRRMFADIEADVYVLVDGDDTYDAEAANNLVQELLDRDLDVVNAARVTDRNQAYRPGHRWGNAVLTTMVGSVFGRRFEDMLSGYKVFSRRFVKSFPALAKGFEIETELTVHALQLNMPVGERQTHYKERPVGSASKLDTWRDGARILRAIVILTKEEKPLAFFGAAGAVLAMVAVALAWPLIGTWLATGLVPRLPTAVLATGLMLLAFLSVACGLVLDSVSRGRREMKRLHYLAQPRIATAAPRERLRAAP